MKSKTIDAKEFDKLFDAGVDISEYLDHSKGKFVYSPEERTTMRQETHIRVEVDLRPETLEKLRKRAREIGRTVSELIEAMVEDRLESRTDSRD